MTHEPMKLYQAAILDGYYRVKGYEGPFRKELDYTVIYFDNKNKQYIDADVLFKLKNLK